MDITPVLNDLKKIYGPHEGFRVFQTIMPGILADFNRMLSSAPAGKPVHEEYRLEDGKAVLNLSGTRKASGETSVSAAVHPL